MLSSPGHYNGEHQDREAILPHGDDHTLIIQSDVTMNPHISGHHCRQSRLSISIKLVIKWRLFTLWLGILLYSQGVPKYTVNVFSRKSTFIENLT